MPRVPRLAAVLFAVVCASGLAAQGMPGAQGGPPPLPDHWLTMDSLVAAVGLTADQKTKVTEPYTALNAVMKEAAAKRQAARQRMMSQASGMDPATMSDADRAKFRAQADSVRGELQAMQDEADQWHAAIRGLLTAEQQAKFDALGKPVLLRQMQRRPPGGD